MTRAPKPDAGHVTRCAFDVWVDRAMAQATADPRARADLPRKARFARGLIARLAEKPALPSLKGLNADDLRGWAARLEKESCA